MSWARRLTASWNSFCVRYAMDARSCLSAAPRVKRAVSGRGQRRPRHFSMSTDSAWNWCRRAAVPQWRRASVPVVLLLFLYRAAVSAAEPPRLRIGTSGDYAPFSALAASGERSGFDIDLAMRLARDLGRAAEFVSFRWPELQNEMREARFDLAASGVTIRP